MELRPRVSIDPVTGTCDSSTVKGTDRRSGHKFNRVTLVRSKIYFFGLSV